MAEVTRIRVVRPLAETDAKIQARALNFDQRCRDTVQTGSGSDTNEPAVHVLSGG